MFTQVLALITFLLFSSAFSYEQVCNHGDQSSLLAFSTSISTSSSSSPLNWSSLVSCCHWEGVSCDASGRVTRLQLHSRGLEGIISSSIGNLGSLTHLNLSSNHLRGALGEEIVRLTNLKTLDLSTNRLHGSIPGDIGNLIHLEKLHLDDNKLDGPIPSSLLMNCSNLEEIILRFNLLDGDISKLDFSRLAHLKKLDLGINRFTGTIPESVYSCKSLVAIRVARNNISGQISPRIIGLKSLSFISITGNFFTNITTTLQVLARCRNVTTLFLSNNFHGESLPVHSSFIGLNGFPKLLILGPGSCNFGGPIPKWLSKLKSLRELDLGSNQMTGRVPDWLGTLPNLVKLTLSTNNLSGEIPPELFKLPALISHTNLNQFRYELPSFEKRPNGYELTWSGGPTIEGLVLGSNRFSGNIPPEIGNLRNIRVLWLNDNNFTGHIPVGISNLINLGKLVLDGNSLTGEIPASLKNLHFLSKFNVSYNDLEGAIPVGGQFNTFDESSYRGNPRLSGELLINHSCNQALAQVVTHGKSHEGMQLFVNGLFVGFAFGFSSVLAIVASYIWFKTSKPCQP